MEGTRRFRILPALVALALILLAAVWALGAAPPPLGVYHLPDGSVLRLDAVTVGPEHHFVKGRYGQRLLAAFLPPGLKEHSGATDVRYESLNRPGIIFWLSGPGVAALMHAFADSARTVVSDELGSHVRLADRPIDIPLGFRSPTRPARGLMTASGEFERGYPLPAFPRRGRTVTLRIWGRSTGWQWVPVAGRRYGRRTYRGPAKWEQVAQFTIPNPDPGPHPVWKPDPLPITRPAGDVDVTLTHLAAETDPPSVGPSFGTPVMVFQLYPHSWTRAGFRITRNGQPAPDWEPVGLELSDATGNVMTPVYAIHYHQAGETRFCFPSGLPPDEEAWKVRAEFAPTAGFTGDDLWTVPNVPVPKGWNSAPIGSTAIRHGARLELTLRLRRMPGRGSLVVEPHVVPTVDGLRITLVRATDDQGRTWTPVRGAGGVAFLPSRREVNQHDLEVISPGVRLSDLTSWRPPEPPRDYELAVPDGVKTLALTFAVVKSRFVEFRARPVRH